jgi:hypothetical protein
LTEQGATNAAPNIHKGTKGSMVATTANHPNHQAMTGRASQGAGAMIGMRTERAIGRTRPPTTTVVRKRHSTLGAQRTRSLMAQPASTRVITTTIPSSQRGDTTQGRQGRKHTNHQTTPKKLHNEQQQVLPPWGQQRVTTTATATPATGDTAYSGLADMLLWGGHV